MGSLIRFAAIAISAVVLLGFAFFAVDEMDRGSKTQQNAVADGLEGADAKVVPIAPSPKEEAARERAHGDVRELVDDAGDVLLAPFADLIESDNPWVTRGVPTILALLIYGLGLGLFANVFPKQRAHGGDWRTAER